MLRFLPLGRPGRLVPALCLLLPAVLCRAAGAQRVDTNPLNRLPEVRAAFQRVYSMDYDNAVRRFEAIQRQHPGDPMATDYVLDAVTFQELNRLDLLDTTFYTNDGFLTGKHTVSEDPKVRDRIRALGAEAVSEADAELKNNPNDVNALFARGWARSLEATYSGMADRAFSAGLREAWDARSNCSRVLQLDPNYVDAKLVVGVYDYVVGSLPFAFKIFIGLVGIRGSRAQGMALLQDDAARGVVTNVEARTAMMLFLRREGKYAEAANIARGLAQEYPHGFLFQLEEANLEKDGGEGMTAVYTYQHLIEMARRTGYFDSAHLELAYYGLGEALRGQAHYTDAVAAYRDGAFQPTTSLELRRRCLLKAGETLDLMHDRAAAVKEYQAVMSAGADTVQGEQAQKYIRSAYAGH
jgi:tetratricopeptide (TPR) repeat protein